MFLNDQAREDFWTVLDNCRASIEERAAEQTESWSSLKEQNDELRAKFEQAEIKI